MKKFNIDMAKVAKVGVTLAGVIVTLAQGYLADKDLDKKVADEVAKALKNQAKGS